jgi:hypothetical protein
MQCCELLEALEQSALPARSVRQVSVYDPAYRWSQFELCIRNSAEDAVAAVKVLPENILELRQVVGDLRLHACPPFWGAVRAPEAMDITDSFLPRFRIRWRQRHGRPWHGADALAPPSAFSSAGRLRVFATVNRFKRAMIPPSPTRVFQEEAYAQVR